MLSLSFFIAINLQTIQYQYHLIIYYTKIIDDFDKNRKASDIKYNKIDTKGYTDVLAKAFMGMF